MNLKILKVDVKCPLETFRKQFTSYLRGLPSSTLIIGGTVMSEIWSRPGKTGVIGLLLCLYWQAEYSGAGKEWEANMKCVESIFNAILATPDL